MEEHIGILPQIGMDRAYRQEPPNKHSAQMMRDLNDLRFAEAINRAKADVDNKAPEPLPHLLTRGKENQLRLERQEQINRENRILLGRMERHFTTQSGVDCHLIQYGPRSLNKSERENELREITAENRRLENAIQNEQPTIIAAKLEGDYQKHRRDYHRLCVNPVVLDPPEERPYLGLNDPSQSEKEPKTEDLPEETVGTEVGGDVERPQESDDGDREGQDTLPKADTQLKDMIEEDLEPEESEEDKAPVDIKEEIVNNTQEEELNQHDEAVENPKEEEGAINIRKEVADDLEEKVEPASQLAEELSQSLKMGHKDDDYVGSNVYVTQQE